jgi:TMEM175 potassium channel family protein
VSLTPNGWQIVRFDIFNQNAANGVTMQESDEFIPKNRLDAFTDGVFAFAMTLLVVNVRLPDDFNPKTSDELLAGLARITDSFIAYIITFLLLAMFWTGQAGNREEPEKASDAYAWTLLSHLFFVTLLPFSMLLAGRYDFAPAIWIYGANLIFLGVTSLGITLAIERDIGHRMMNSGRIELGVLIGSALLSMAIAVFAPDAAMYAYVLNLVPPLFRRWARNDRRRRSA